MKQFNTYEQLTEFALSGCKKTAEKTRIEKEKKLFAERKWENYVLFLANLVNSPLGRTNKLPTILGGSVADSYIIRKVTGNTQMRGDLNSILSDGKAENVLLNDALRLVILQHESGNTLKEISTRMVNLANEMGLKYSTGILPNRFSAQVGLPSEEAVYIAFGNVDPTDNDKKVIEREKRESTEQEKETLRQYLLVYFVTFSGI